ncbi:amino acid transporter [Tilletiaria anomala UBC 951]|uniref:Amino acid transporter n=1 Tax=Tilletiaria anomala (strain ATCC 24038 / CBS 436.72 / UBC 951) TaxID=1037660 RepID=A0A066WCT5_TILAU|nr:amino acid transporter [Tilletiaria anomala UBC 951]KDN48869.1 amino acid transporter [Tilletiaria anomala UBC 951]
MSSLLDKITPKSGSAKDGADRKERASMEDGGATVSHRRAQDDEPESRSSPLPGLARGGGVVEALDLIEDDDDRDLAERMGHKSEFAREFKSLSTISFAFSIMGLISSVATTWNTPFLYGGYATTIWAWAMGSFFNLSLATAIGEIISAYPSAGGLYSASGLLVPKKYRAITAWCTGWLNYTGQIAGIAGTAWGLSLMLWAYAYVATGYTPPGSATQSNGAYVGLYIAIMVVHGLIVSFDNKWLAKMTSAYVFINLGITVVTSIVVLARTPASEMLTGHEAFGQITDNTGYQSQAFAFFIGLQCVQFVMTDYDATAHMSEDIHRASYAAPVALFFAVGGTGIFGFLLNTAMVFGSRGVLDADVMSFPGQLAFAQVLLNRAGRVGFLIIWPFIMAVAWFVITTALQANSRSFYAFSRDGGLPDNKFFARVNKRTRQTVNATWLVVVLCVVMIFLSFASTIAVGAIFSLAAWGMDTSYLIPIICRLIFQDHPDVRFKPGPFYLGRGMLSTVVNYTAVVWTLFEVIVLSFPIVTPYTPQTFNYSWVIAIAILILALLWYAAWAHRHYQGPHSSMSSDQLRKLGIVSRAEEADAASNQAPFSGRSPPPYRIPLDEKAT